MKRRRGAATTTAAKGRPKRG